jgi:hypothetical protein
MLDRGEVASMAELARFARRRCGRSSGSIKLLTMLIVSGNWWSP